MGENRDLKKATEAYWGGKLSQKELLEEGKRLRLAHWKIQKDAGVDIIPSNDFSFYDQVLDHHQLFGVSVVVPPVFGLDFKMDMIRSFRNAIPSITLILLTNSLRWVEVSRSLQKMGRRLLTSPV